MPPLTRLTLTSAGRAGSLSVTGMRSPPDCAWPRAGRALSALSASASAAPTAADRADNRNENRLDWLFMVFKNADVSIQIFNLDLRPARSDARPGVAVRAKNHFSA